MSKLRLLVLAVAICAVASLTTAAGASAAPCYSSTPSSVALPDSGFDSELGISPEIVSLNASIDSACNASFSYSVTGQTGLIAGEFYSWFLDTDNNVTTGTQSGFRGAEFALGMLDSGSVALLQWNGSSFVTTKPLSRTATFGGTTTLSDIGANPGTPIAIAGGGSWEGISDTYYDWVPEPGYAWLSMLPIFSTQPPVAPESDDPGCVVPKVRGYSINRAKSRIRNAGCRVGKTRKRVSSKYIGKVVGSSPSKGAHLAAGARVNIYVGKRGSRRVTGSAAGATAELTAVRINQMVDAAR